MLEELFIDNFVIIKRDHIFFEDGFNVLTGETGSGKSLIFEAINLALGKRADKDTIGKFADKTLIEAVFEVEEDLKDKLYDMGFSFDDDNKLIITRTIGKKSSSVRINGRMVSLALLRELAGLLIDIYRQGDSNSFMNSSNYGDLIDEYTKDKESQDLLDELYGLNKEREGFLERFSHINLSDEEVRREKDLLNYQINEIEDVDIFNIDEEAINMEYQKLNSITSIINITNKIKEMLDSSDFTTPSVTSYINEAISDLDDFTSMDNKIEDIYQRLITLSDEVNDLYNDLDSYEMNLEQDPERLYELEMINQAIFSLKRKYGSSLDEIKTYYEEIKSRRSELEDIEDLRANINKEISKIDKKMEKTASELSNIRKKKAKVLENEINSAIRELNIKNGNFKISFDTKDSINNKGLDKIDFLISTNKGESLKSLSKTASGGEISRIMLAFKEVFSDSDKVGTLIFDEIDTGISGRTAQLVGERILKLSRKRQIIAISHLPQIASLASNHILISKEDLDSFTISKTERVEGANRVNEIARLIGGVDITPTTIESSKEMLKMAEDLRNAR
ncbi:MAG: DNA repair protein RecN [Peptoniphilaceae bacterium]|nr:DNA repair protein RecN [Anaerococcus sp.]MDD7044664.1 DNA repair protein RecN [Peptoniphilaceae bacterium]